MKSAFFLGTTVAAAALATLVALPIQSAGAQDAPAQNAPAQNAPAQNAPGKHAIKQNGAAQNAPNKPAAKPPAKPEQDAPKGGEAKPEGGSAEMPHDADAAITARYTKAAAVGEEHQWLAKLAGKWKTASKQTIKPNSTSIEATGTSEFKLFMDGRFLIENNSSGGAQGNAQGMGILGFNNVTSKYERVWFDSRSTAMVKSEGEYQKERDEIRWTDQWSDPVKGQIVTTRSSLRRLDEKRMVFTQSVTLQNNQEFNSLVVQYQKVE
jgi:hypothetical protein